MRFWARWYIWKDETDYKIELLLCYSMICLCFTCFPVVYGKGKQSINQKDMRSLYSNLRLRDDWLLLIVTIFTTIVNGLVPAATSILTGRVFGLLHSLNSNTYASKSDFIHELTLRAFSIAAVAACVIPISWISLTCWMCVGERQGFRIRKSLVRFYFNRNLQWYDKNETLEGDFIQLNRCVEEVRAGSAESSAIIFQNVTSIIALIVTSMYYSWSLTLIILCSTPVLAVLATFFSYNVEKFAKLENEASAQASLVLSWSLNAFQMIRLFNTAHFEETRFERLALKCNKYFIKSCLFSALNASTLRFLTLCMFVQGFWFGNTQVRKGKLNAGDVITCFSSCLQLGSCLSSTLQQLVTLQKGKVAMEKIQGQLSDQDATNDDSSTLGWEKRESIISSTSSLGLAPSLYKGDIKVRNVSFAYPTRPDDYVLKDVSLDIKEGSTTFIVGRSGSGKSTLANLLLKMYSNYSGSIELGGYNLQGLDDSWILEQFTLVEQRCTLFNRTLKENITIVDRNATDEMVRQACQFALLSSLLIDLPDGIDTLLGRHGVTLSGGQQQRVALARSYIRNTPILILDEAMSALDISSRNLMIEAFRYWRKGKITIILTHEYSQIRDDEFVYLMREGKVIESGLKSSLLEDQDSNFCQLYHLQDNALEESTMIESVVPYSPDKTKYDMGTVSRFSKFFFDGGVVDTQAQTDSFTKRLGFKNGQVRVKPDSIEKALQSDNIEDLERQERPRPMTLTAILKKINKTIPHRRYLVLGLFFSVIAGVANPMFSYIFSKLLTGLVPKGSAHSSSSYYLMKWSVIVMSIAAIDGISTFLKDFILGYCSEIWILRLRIMAMHKITRKPLNWFTFSVNNSSELNSLLMNDLRDLRGLASEFLSAITTLICVAAVGLTWALISGWKLSLVCFSLIPVFILFSGIYGSLLQMYESAYKTEIAELETRIHEVVTSMKTIKTLSLQQQFEDEIVTQRSKVKSVSKKRSVAVGFGIAITNALALVVQAILYYYGIKLVINGDYSVSKMFQTFTLLLFSIMTCVSLINQVPEISRGQRAATYIFKVLEESEHDETYNLVQSGRPAYYLNPVYGNTVEVKHLSFAYPNSPSQKVFKSLNFHVQTNETVGIIGESGSGKSTIALLLTRLYPVPNGKINIGIDDINDWDEHSLRRTIVIVEQKTNFFDGTLRENLVYGLKTHVTDSELLSVLQLVDLKTLVENLPEYLDTRIHTGLLSGGQAQRLSIARALLRKPKIIILDECTSALDAANSFAIAEVIKSVMKNITVIIITHSQQMMQICDRLLVLRKGKICEEGSYADLYNRRGEMYRIVVSASM